MYRSSNKRYGNSIILSPSNTCLDLVSSGVGQNHHQSTRSGPHRQLDRQAEERECHNRSSTTLDLDPNQLRCFVVLLGPRVLTTSRMIKKS